VNARCAGVAPLIDLPRNMSVVKHRCHGLSAIAQLAGAIGCAYSQIFYRCRKRASGSATDRRLVFAGAAAEFSRANIRIRSDSNWPEKIVLDTRQPTIAPPAVNEPPALLIRLPPDEPPDQSNIEAMAQLPPDPPSAAVDHPTLRTKRGLAPLHVSWHERKQTGAVVSLGGSTTVKQAQRPCRAGKPHRHGLWMGRRTP
jgi:hypothetical protein